MNLDGDFLPEDEQPQSQQLTDDELLAIVNSEIRSALGSPLSDDEQTGNFTKALDYYFLRPRGDEKDGRSHVQSPDVQNAVDSTLSEIIQSFNHTTPVAFQALAPEDEHQATKETELVAAVFKDDCDGYLTLYQAFKDALLQRNGIVKVSMEETREVFYRTYPGPVDPTVLPQLLAPKYPGEQIEPVSNDENTLTLRHSVPNKRPRVDNIPPEDFMVNSDHRSVDLQEARFVAQHQVLQASTLVSMGFDPDIVAELPTYSTDTSAPALSRSRGYSESEHSSADDATRPIEVYDCWIRVDYDLDDFAELRHVMISHNTVLVNEPEDWIPFAAGAAFIMPHRFYGLSLFDKLKETQDTKTAILRQTLDNGFIINNQRVAALEGAVNLDDLLDSRAGGVVRVTMPNAVTPLPIQNLSNTGFNLLEYMDKVRRESGGTAIDSAQQAQQVAGDTAHGVERVMSTIERMNGMIAQTLAETLVKDIFVLLHRNLRTFIDQPVQVQTSPGEWLTENPALWPPRTRMRISTGMSQGERMRQAQALTAISQLQQQIKQSSPGILVTDAHIFNALTDAVRLAGLSNPEQYWQDPNSEPAQEAAKQQQQQNQQLQEAQQAQQQTMQQLMEAQVQIEAQKVTITQMRDQMKTMQTSIDREWDREKFFEQQRKDYTEMELKYNKDVPGEGMSNVQPVNRKPQA